MYELEGRKGEEREWVRGMGKRKGVRPAAFFGFCAFAAAAGLRPAAAAAVVCPLTLWNKGYKVPMGLRLSLLSLSGVVLKGAVVSLEKRRKKVAYGCTWMASLVETPSAVPLSGKI